MGLIQSSTFQQCPSSEYTIKKPIRTIALFLCRQMTQSEFQSAQQAQAQCRFLEI